MYKGDGNRPDRMEELMKTNKDKLNRAVAVLEMVRRYKPIPDPSPLLRLRGKRREHLEHALDVAERPIRIGIGGALEARDGVIDEVMFHLGRALQDDMMLMSDALAFIACAHGQKPVRHTWNTVTGEHTVTPYGEIDATH